MRNTAMNDAELNPRDYDFLVGMAQDLVATVLSSDRLHVPAPGALRVYDARLGLTNGNRVGQRLNVGYDADGFVCDVWVG